MTMAKKTNSITETRDQKEDKEIAYIRSRLAKAEQSGFTCQTKEEILEEFKAELRASGVLQAKPERHG